MEGASNSQMSIYRIIKLVTLFAILLTCTVYYILSVKSTYTTWLLPTNFSSLPVVRHLNYIGGPTSFFVLNERLIDAEKNDTLDRHTRISAWTVGTQIPNTATEKISDTDDSEDIVTVDDSMVNFEIPEFVRSHIPVVKCDSQKYLVYKCFSFCGGLGDREKGITTTFLMALLTNRTFLIDMPTPCDIATLLRPNLYDWQKCNGYLKNRTTKRLHFMRLFNLQELQINTWSEDVIYVQSNVIGLEEIRKHPRVKTQIPWLYNGTRETVMGYILGLLFRVNKNIQRHVVNLITTRVKKSTLICTHIRYGRNPSNPNDNRRREGPPNVQLILDFLSNFANSSKYTIYLATDSDDVKSDARTRFTNLLTDPGKIMHVDRSRGQNVDGCVGFETVIREQYILSRCDTLILTRSGFGGMAAYMRGHSRGLYLYYKQTDSVLKVNISMINYLYKFV